MGKPGWGDELREKIHGQVVLATPRLLIGDPVVKNVLGQSEHLLQVVDSGNTISRSKATVPPHVEQMP